MAEKLDYETLERAYAEASKGGPEPDMVPSYTELSLKALRYICSDMEPGEGVKAFLEMTKDLPETYLVALTPDHIGLLKDKDGNQLEWS